MQALCSILSIALAVTDIVVTSVTLYKYYNRDHLPIPHHMVDLSYNEDEETSYVPYTNVLDQTGKAGDVNGGGGKQWLALYSTTDEDAGDPILAPDGDENTIEVKYKDGKVPEGASPVHLFGTPDTAQNLTFEDGESGWSFNDKNGGTYRIFRRGERTEEGDAQEGQTGTAWSSIGDSPIKLVFALVIGLVIGVAGTLVISRRRRNDAENEHGDEDE